MPIPVDTSVKPQLFDYCKTNEPLLTLFSYWVDLLEDNGGEYNLVSAYDLGTLARVVRTGAIDKATSSNGLGIQGRPLPCQILERQWYGESSRNRV